MRALIAGLLIVTAGLAGCLGGDEDPGDEQLKQTATVDRATGGIQGVVTDNAVQPVSGANVTLVETDETVRTAADGSFAFSRVAPGPYTVVVQAPGFVSGRQEVTVHAGQVSAVDFLLTHLFTSEAYSQVLELAGFFECGFEVGWDLRDEAPDPGGPVDPRFFFLGLALCAVPNFYLPGNATNDRFLHFFDLEPPLDTLLYEMHWEANGPFSEWMTSRMEVAGFSNDAIGTIFRIEGTSPIQVRLDRADWDELAANFTAACEGQNDTTPNDAYCGYSFRDNGWPLQTRVFPAYQCQSDDGAACVVLQQEFTHYMAAFYNAPPPEGYQVVG